MIVFDGIDLQDIAPVKIEDIRVSPIQLIPVARQKVGFGQNFVRMDGKQRTVTITFALATEDLNERYQQLQRIAEWAQPYKEKALSLPMFDNRYLECMCVGYPDPSYRQWWESRLTLVFITYANPYWTSDNEIRANCGTQFTVNGSAPPLMRIERRLTSKIANQTYACKGKSMVFDRIPAGSMVIDLNKQTAEVSGASIMQYFTKTSKFIDPSTGNMTITGVGTVVYRERWI